MSYGQQPSQRYGMPMPYPSYPPQNYPVQSRGSHRPPSYPVNPPTRNTTPYPSAGSNHATPYPSAGGNQPTPYPSSQSTPYPTPYSSSTTQSTPYPSNTTQSTPYPTSNIQSMSIRNPPYPKNGTQGQNSAAQTSQFTSEIDGWIDTAIISLLAIFKDASNEELKAVINNEDKLIDIVQSTEEMKKLQQKREEMTAHNRDQAVTNVSLEPELGILRSNLVELAREQNQLKEKYIELQQKIAANISMDKVSAILQAETSKAETESDEISHAFLDNGSVDTVDDFLNDYITKRTKYQLRKVKSEKMTQLIRGGVISTPGNSTEAANPRVPVPAARHPVQQGGNYGGYVGY